MSRRLSRDDWDAYIREFHRDRPGITQTLLTRCDHQGQNPYEWLTDGLSAVGVTLDLACGGAPIRCRVGAGWIGLDASATELEAASLNATGRALQGDLARLPIREGSCQTVVCSMALMLIAPLDRALREIRRALEPTGSLRILLPAHRPLTTADRLRYARVGLTLRTSTLFPPSPLTRHARFALHQAGLEIEADDSCRFTYTLNASEDWELFIDSLYLPTVSRPRHERAKRSLRRSGIGSTFGIPIRRITARPVAGTRPTSPPWGEAPR